MNEQTNHAALPLIESLLDGTIDDAGFARLESLLRVNAHARAVYRSYANLHAALPEVVRHGPRLSVTLSDETGERLLEPHDMPHAQLISLLAQVEAQGEDLDPMVLAAERFPQQADEVPTGQDWKNAGRYLIGRVKAHRQQVVMGLAAAVMLFAAVVVVTWSQADKPIGPIAIAPVPDPPAVDGPAQPNAPVATLTAEHDAQWQSDFDYGTPAPGDVFYPGRTLTLLSGYAEITTNQGAVAIIESPATVEVRGKNVLYLHAGRLVGLCHTESSKGFVVKTDQVSITDLGTEFGVQAMPNGLAATVFVGEVQLTTPDEQSHTIQGRQTANVKSKGGIARVEVVDATTDELASSYTRRLPRSPLVKAVRLNDVAGLQAEVVPQSFYESALLYSDRDYQAMPSGDTVLPRALLGGDVVRMPAEAKFLDLPGTESMQVEVTLSGPAQVYVLVPPNAELQDWLARDYERTEMAVALGISNKQGVTSELLQVRVCQVWQRRQPVSGTAIIAGSIKDDSTGMYTLVVTPLNQETNTRSAEPE